MFNKVKNVFPLDDYKLLVQFCVGVTKIYDVKPLFNWKDVFKTTKASFYLKHHTYTFAFYCSVTQSCPTCCNTMDCSTPGLSILHHSPEFAETHAH